MTDLYEKLLLFRVPGIGPVKYNAMVEKFGTVTCAVQNMNLSSQHRDSVMREMENAAAQNIIYLSEDDARYPKNLRNIKNHPPIISVRGNIATLERPSVAMVGTRHASGAGLRFMDELAAAFTENGYAVISGMAMGTDAAAHNGALRTSGNAQTIAVLAGGVDYIWPLENESLYEKILERGCVISEMPVGFTPVANNFVQRNRLVAGICDKLILGEADAKSGSVHTARFAIDYKKPVFAIPSHPSDSRSHGPNTFIRDGYATLCMGKNDFFDGVVQKNTKKSVPENGILDALGINPLSESVLAELVKKTIPEIKRDLVILELQGIVAKQDGGYVKL